MPASPKVQILDETTANQIAAGEVVERPAAAVKELVENALDAGARHITVELDEGGKYLIRVTDDGSGMDQEDAILALQRHATSKIRSADDLFHITTMGFRGEALPSIASVSQFKMVTKTNDAGTEEHSGIEIVCNGGKMDSVTEVGAPSGTSITIENLFFNVPARLKFLKTSATELNHSLELIQHLALSYPQVAFRLIHQGSEVFASSGNGSMLDVCVQVFGRDTARHLIPMDYQGGGARVTGFIGTPAALKGSRSAQHTFVNHRFVRNKAVTRALDEAYKSVQTIHGTKYAVAVIMIEIDPAQVDINVSPTKTEVRFIREGDVYSSVYHAVKEGLMAGALVPSIAAKTNSTAPARGTEENPVLLNVPSRPAANTQRTPMMPPLTPRFDDELVEPASPRREILPSASRTEAERQAGFLPEANDPFQESRDFTAPPTLIPDPIATPEAPTEERTMGEDYRHHSLRSLRVLAQTRNMYILAQTENSLVLIDQHIAHERVLYEKLLAGAEGAGGGVPTQRLMLPFTLELSKREALVIQDRLPDLAKAGFEMEPFGGDSFVVRSVPASIARKSLKAQDGPEATLRAIIDELVEKSSSRRMLLPAEEVLITASCKMAVKAGDPLSFEEMDALVADLLKSENPYTCPHGRPIIVELANSDLDRKFGR